MRTLFKIFLAEQREGEGEGEREREYSMDGWMDR
jgi:hypothetical protein